MTVNSIRQQSKPKLSLWPEELTEMQAQMRESDTHRIASGEASPQQIQEENSLFRSTCSFRIEKLGI